ncbi:MAG: glucose 1-dehydrogenase [Pseudomonadales bacterium]|jgi:3(or 17)beta-hydroxysteroid dehydrogenase|nr:glucose 1-dehydrogenase [Pseudomonadales bacterium]MCC6530775.1 glucose 1-dehydrogenase [Pseudomonadales bacterium]MCP5331930.1 glucose 1-dehydrogenase [Pseudomonadales bacterium]HMU89726.1 glucose 1-dehydrogenase [Pseudomonadales bacterium]HMW14577.1 glucose 1-dehydrogenase [Pseudomonadales bacterium]
MTRLADKFALVTGGASGLGRAQSLTMAREGAAVAVTDLNIAGAEAVAAEIRAQGGRAIALPHDVADESSWQEVMGQTLNQFGRLSILVNNAGIAASVDAEEGSLADWRHLMSINLDGVFLGVKHGIRALKQSGGGSIINISSIMGLIGSPGSGAYNASKGGVRLLTKSAALYCAKAGYGIRVNSVHPGFIDTPMIQRIMQGPQAEAARQNLIALHPIGRLGVPQDIANGVLFLASDESAFVTGSELVIDGGYTAQ